MNEHEFASIIRDTKPIVLSAIEKNLIGAYYNFIDDVAQETYLRAYRALSKNKFKGDSSISTWIYAIARNEAKRMNLKLSKEEIKAKRKAEKELQNISHNTSLKVDIDILALNEGINNLPDKYKEVLLGLTRFVYVVPIVRKLFFHYRVFRYGIGNCGFDSRNAVGIGKGKRNRSPVLDFG